VDEFSKLPDDHFFYVSFFSPSHFKLLNLHKELVFCLLSPYHKPVVTFYPNFATFYCVFAVLTVIDKHCARYNIYAITKYSEFQ